MKLKLSFGILLISLIFLVGCENPESNNSGLEEMDSRESLEQSYVPFEKIVVSGTGDRSTEYIELKEGPIEFHMLHTGDSNFIIQLLDFDGEIVEFLANEIGVYSGEKVIRIDETGDYLFTVNANGQWEIIISDPRAPSEEIRVTLEEGSNTYEEPKEVLPWEEFLAECSSQFAKSIFLSNKNYYTDKCEKEYAKEFNLPEYCEKIGDRSESENCWLSLALKNNDVELCMPLKTSGTSTDSPYQSCKKRVSGSINQESIFDF
jgi:hypothetical protein